MLTIIGTLTLGFFLMVLTPWFIGIMRTSNDGLDRLRYFIDNRFINFY